MDPGKLIDMQRQMKQNNEDYADFLKDLDSWKEDICVTEKKVTDSSTNGGDLPPVRNSLLKKKMKKKLKSDKKESVDKPKKISGFDFRAWEKFDVDKACEDVDNRKSSDSEYTTDEEWEEERRVRLAADFKEKGNQEFKSGRLEMAVEHYTRAVELDPEQPVYYCNRALVHLKLSRFGAAEQDCSSAIQLDSKNSKAFYRRAQALLQISKKTEALEDLKIALHLEPNSCLIKNDYDKLRHELHPEDFDSGRMVAPLYRKASPSKKPLRRIKIQEVGRQSTSKTNLEHSVKVKTKKPTFDVPKTSFDFYTSLQSLKNHSMDDSYDYLSQIPTEKLPTLLGQSIEADTLMVIVKCFCHSVTADSARSNLIISYLKQLTNAKRFDMTVMFLGKDDKQLILNLFQLLGSDADELRKSYGLS